MMRNFVEQDGQIPDKVESLSSAYLYTLMLKKT